MMRDRFRRLTPTPVSGDGPELYDKRGFGPPAAVVRGLAVIDLIRRALTQLGVFAANPWAFLIVVMYGVLWFLFDRETFGWQGLATMAVWFMTLLIQRAEHRDTQAVHAKLDELLHAQSRASNAMTRIDEEQPEDIERHREQARKDD
jgi:low affinity Fe/Cu permease